jgi:hypothetical protein
MRAVLLATAGAWEGEAAFLLTLLSPDDGVQRLKNALRSRFPLARQEAAFSLGLLGAAKARRVLAWFWRSEARAVRRLLRGLEPEPGPEPVGKEIEWRGKKRRTYSFDEILKRARPLWAGEGFKRWRQAYASILKAWRAR